MKNCVNILFIFSIVLFSCSQNGQNQKLNFNEGYSWYYRYYHTSKNIPGYENEPPTIDTIMLKIIEKSNLGKDSAMIKFNQNFIRFWDYSILETDSGYRYYLGHYGAPFLIKYPIVKNHRWQQRFTSWVQEECKISCVDTTVILNNQIYKNCFIIEVNRSYDGWIHHIQMYFNKKYGLLYYSEPEFEEKYTLLKMEKVKRE